MFDRLEQLIERLRTYSPWVVLVELAIIWIIVRVIVRFVQGTRAAGALKGALFVVITGTLLVRILGQRDSFQRLTFLYQTFLTIIAVALIVVFQPELRRAFIRLGETPLFRRGTSGVGTVAGAIVEACAYLSKANFGAIIVIEREAGLRGLVEGGTPIDAQLSSRLLQTIFFPGTALHDLAVVIVGDRVAAANVQLPLAEPGDMPDPGLGARHRAAVGLTRECDALVIVVSEETGAISIAERGRLERGLSPQQLREALELRISKGRAPPEQSSGAPRAASAPAAAQPAGGSASS